MGTICLYICGIMPAIACCSHMYCSYIAGNGINQKCIILLYCNGLMKLHHNNNR